MDSRSIAIAAALDGLPGEDPAVTVRAGVFQGVGFLAETTVDVPALDAASTPESSTALPGEFVAKDKARRRGRLFLIPATIPMGDLLKLVGIIVEQRERIVYVNEMVGAWREAVRLRDLTALYGDPEKVGDWETHQEQRGLP